MSLISLRKKLSQLTLIRVLSSLKLTVACLFLLGVLTFLGTLAQVKYGLYIAQEKFFNSLLIFYGLLPIPSARLVIWILFINLIAALLLRFNYTKKNLGLVTAHIGLVILLISGFLTMHFSQESFVALKEGERTNIASDYMDWELLCLKHETKGSRQVIIPVKQIKIAKWLDLTKELGFKLKVNKRYINGRYFDTPFAGRILKELPVDKQYENNNRVLFLDLDFVGEIKELILEGENVPLQSFSYKGLAYDILLRKKQYKLPFAIELVDVERELHPGTDTAKSYKSKIIIHQNNISRELSVSMNKPFRSGLYTAYQASYGIDQEGNEISQFAIVKNLNHSLPYIGSLIAALGLFMHFITAFLRYSRRID